MEHTQAKWGQRAPRILVFDSGLGGLTVFRAIHALLPGADYLYLADDARFPYGALEPDDLIAGVLSVIAEAEAGFRADCIVIACNTASTLVLPALRAVYAAPIVGTVPAIKPAAAASQSGFISVLATPGTVSRDYTAELIRDFASGVDVTLVGSHILAGFAERALRGELIADGDILAEIAPCFVSRGGMRTDHVVLACTHYPLLLARFERLAPWPVTWVDPAPAIARRVAHILGRAAPGIGRLDARSTKPDADTALLSVMTGILAVWG
ncbi:MurI Glutamate racemase [Rhabdaerophilaceae bacterium]